VFGKRIILKLARNEIWIFLFATRHIIGWAVRLHEWFEIRLSPRTRFADRANTYRTQNIVLFSIDNLCRRMCVCFPVLFSIILFYLSLKTVLQMPSTIDKCLSGLAVKNDVLYSVIFFFSNFPPPAYIYTTKNICKWFSLSPFLLLSNVWGFLSIWIKQYEFCFLL